RLMYVIVAPLVAKKHELARLADAEAIASKREPVALYVVRGSAVPLGRHGRPRAPETVRVLRVISRSRRARGQRRDNHEHQEPESHELSPARTDMCAANPPIAPARRRPAERPNSS